MPTYLYVCSRCGPFTEHRSIHVDSSLAICPECGIEVGKVFVSPQVSPRIHAGRPSGPPQGPRNSWEKGIVTDHRGVPVYADTSAASPIPVKDFAANRSKYEERIRRLETHPDPCHAGANKGR